MLKKNLKIFSKFSHVDTNVVSTGYARQRNEMVSRATAPEALLVKCVKCLFQPVSWPDRMENYAKMEAFVRMVTAPLSSSAFALMDGREYIARNMYLKM